MYTHSIGFPIIFRYCVETYSKITTKYIVLCRLNHINKIKPIYRIFGTCWFLFIPQAMPSKSSHLFARRHTRPFWLFFFEKGTIFQGLVFTVQQRNIDRGTFRENYLIIFVVILVFDMDTRMSLISLYKTPLKKMYWKCFRQL